MKKLIVLLIISSLFLSILPVNANASTTVNYDSMSEYDGFAKAVYDSYVTNTTYITGKYTNNLDYVNETISEIKSNANLLWNGFKNEDCGEGCNWGWEFIKQLLAGGLTAIDFIKGFFNKQNNDLVVLDYSYWDNILISDGWNLYPKMGYSMTITDFTGRSFNVDGTGSSYNGLSVSSAGDNAYLNVVQRMQTTYLQSQNTKLPWSDVVPLITTPPYSVSKFMTIVNNLGGINIVVYNSETGEVNDDVLIPNENFNQINNYIQSNNNIVHPNYKPQINAELVCPSITTSLQIVGSDLKVNDQILNVNKTTSQTVYNSEDCVVNFNAVMPQVTEDNKIVVPNGDGTVTDVETNEKLDQYGNIIQPEYNGNPDNCDGILCFMSSLIKSIGGMVSAIVNAITGLIDMLFHLIVPENLDFITDLFDSLKTTFTEKFAITTDIQNLFKSIFTESTTNPLSDLSFTLPATDTELSFSVFSVVDDYVPMIKRIISALLALMTLMYVYRKITGSGGVMEK